MLKNSTTIAYCDTKVWTGFLVTGFVVSLAVLHLPYPFGEDQAMFMAAARELSDGAHMYGEFWDMKQPGIYWWYLAAGRLFGFDAVGLRCMDMCWLVGVTLLVWHLLKPGGTLAALLGPILSFGSFYALTSAWHLSQVEWLVCAPLLVIVLCMSEDQRGLPASSSVRYALGGMMLATVALFKLLVVPVGAAMVLAALVAAHRAEKQSWRVLAKKALTPFVLGGLVLLAPVVLWMQFHGTLRMALWTALIYPGMAVKEYQRHSVHMFLESLAWFGSGVWTLIPWALWGVIAGVRRGSRLELLLFIWILTACASISVQLLSYWQYHFDLLFVPVGMLAALGFVDVLAHLPQRRRPNLRALAVAVLLLGITIGIVRPLIRKTHAVIATRAFLPLNQRAFDLTLDSGEQVLFDSADAVRPLSKESDRIVVWGDPRLYFLVGRRPIVEVDGGTFYLNSQLNAVAEAIRNQRPALVYLSKFRDQMTYHGSGVIPRVVNENYIPCFDNVAGTWYRLREVKDDGTHEQG